MAKKYKRVLLKLSGESLMGEKEFGIQPKMLTHYAEQIKELFAQFEVIAKQSGVILSSIKIIEEKETTTECQCQCESTTQVSATGKESFRTE